jgi:hypothetical protein
LPPNSARGTTRFAFLRENCCSELPAAIKAMAEPMVSHDCIGFYLLSREVAKTCRPCRAARALTRCSAAITGTRRWSGRRIPSPPTAKRFSIATTRSINASVQAISITATAAGEFVREHFAAAGRRPRRQGAATRHHVMLVDDPVKRVDNMTMAWGLEARVPFLDHELVELAARVPAEHKLCGSDGKRAQGIGRRVIPKAVIDRPKGYFPVPALKYLRGEVLDTCATPSRHNAPATASCYSRTTSRCSSPIRVAHHAAARLQTLAAGAAGAVAAGAGGLTMNRLGQGHAVQRSAALLRASADYRGGAQTAIVSSRREPRSPAAGAARRSC